MSSRDIDDLVETARSKCRAWVAACAARDVEVLVYCTYRSPAEQDRLYAQGRTAPGPVVTWARAWQSWHQVRRAWDAVPMVGGKPLWGYSASLLPWQVVVEEADRLGIEWAGRWTHMREMVHYQVADGLDLEGARQLVETMERAG